MSTTGSKITLMAMSMPMLRAAAEGCERLHMVSPQGLGMLRTARTTVAAESDIAAADKSMSAAGPPNCWGPLAAMRAPARRCTKTHRTPEITAASAASQIMGASLPAAPSCAQQE